MRKIVLTILGTVCMIAVTYVPFLANQFETQTGQKISVSVTHANEAGEQCAIQDDCDSGLHCAFEGGRDFGTCELGGKLGDTCFNSTGCAPGLRCDMPGGQDQGQCVAGDDGAGEGGDDGAGEGSDDGAGIGSRQGSSQNPPPGAGDCDPSIQLCNPLKSKYGTLCLLLNGILKLVTQIGAMIAVLLIIWSGFKFITAQGNSSALTEAKKTFYHVILGTAILLGASAIAQVVVKTVLTITNKENPGICNI